MLRLIAAAALLATTALPAAANVINPTAGNPLNLGNGTTESNLIQAFREAQGVAIDAVVLVDRVGPFAPNTQITGASTPFGTPETPGVALAAGIYNSSLIHFDPIDDGSSTKTVRDVTFTFETDIVGLIFNAATLAGTDAIFGRPGTTYVFSGSTASGPASFGRRIESVSSVDQFTIVNPRTLRVDVFTTANLNIDQIRVLTAATVGTTEVPVPAPLALLAAGAAGVALARRRRAA